MVGSFDGGVIVCGNGQYNSSLIKVDSNGVVIWAKQFGREYGSLSSIIQTSDSNFVAIGSINYSQASSNDLWLIKIDRNGNLITSKRFEKSESQGGVSIVQTMDGGFILVGSEFLYTSTTLSVIIVKVDSLFNTEWSKMMTGSTFITSPAIVKQLPDSTFLLGGYIENSQPNSIFAMMSNIDQSGNII